MNSETPGTDKADDPAIEKAIEIIDRNDNKVLATLFELLKSSSEGSWESKHTTNALSVMSGHLEQLSDLRKYAIDSEERKLARNQLPYLLGLAFLGILLVSWLFLHYGKPEFIAAIITGIGGFFAGMGYSKISEKK